MSPKTKNKGTNKIQIQPYCIFTLDYISNFTVRINASNGVWVNRIGGTVKNQGCRNKKTVNLLQTDHWDTRLTKNYKYYTQLGFDAKIMKKYNYFLLF